MATFLHIASDRIRLCRDIAEIRQSDCEMYGIGLGTYKKWEKSETITSKASVKLAEMFVKVGVRVSEEWLETGIGDLPEKIYLPMPGDNSVINQELRHFTFLNRDKHVLAQYLIRPIGTYFKVDDLVAGFATEDVQEVINELCIIDVGNNMFHIEEIKKVDFESKVCTVLPEDKNRSVKINFEHIAKIVWLRKK